jgi:hypothetical protein
MQHSTSRGWIRGCLAGLASGGLVLSMAGTVFASQPDRGPVGNTPFIVEGSCAFPVEVNQLADGEYIQTFYDRDGNARLYLVTGVLKVTVTNADTGASLTLNVSGPGQFVDNPDGSTTASGGGPWLYWAFDGDATGAGMWYTRGYITFLIEPDGSNPIAQLPPNTMDVCAALS